MGLRALVDKYCTVMPLLWWKKKKNTTAGKTQYEVNPTVVTCRWDHQMVEVIDDEGRTITSNAMIMTPYEIPIGSWVFQGTMAEWRAMTGIYPNVPPPDRGGYEIVKGGHTPGFHGEELLYVYYV